MIFRTANSSNHLAEILQLQRSNLRNQRSEEEIAKEGFVTCEHSIDLLQKMNKPYPHVIAVENSKVVGYALVMLSEMRDALDVLKPMFKKIDDIYLQQPSPIIGSYFVMGQVCIDKSYRGQGLFYSLYNHMKEKMSSDFDICITEVSSHNKRSLRAHANQGFRTILTYHSEDGHPWEILAWDWS